MSIKIEIEDFLVSTLWNYFIKIDGLECWKLLGPIWDPTWLGLEEKLFFNFPSTEINIKRSLNTFSIKNFAVVGFSLESNLKQNKKTISRKLENFYLVCFLPEIGNVGIVQKWYQHWRRFTKTILGVKTFKLFYIHHLCDCT